MRDVEVKHGEAEGVDASSGLRGKWPNLETLFSVVPKEVALSQMCNDLVLVF